MTWTSPYQQVPEYQDQKIAEDTEFLELSPLESAKTQLELAIFSPDYNTMWKVKDIAERKIKEFTGDETEYLTADEANSRFQPDKPYEEPIRKDLAEWDWIKRDEFKDVKYKASLFKRDSAMAHLYGFGVDVVGGFADPVNLLAGAALGKVATTGLRAASIFKTAEKAGNLISNMPFLTNTLRGVPPDQILKFGAQAAAQNALAQIPIEGLEAWRKSMIHDQPHTLKDAAYNVAIGAVVGTAFETGAALYLNKNPKLEFLLQDIRFREGKKPLTKPEMETILDTVEGKKNSTSYEKAYEILHKDGEGIYEHPPDDLPPPKDFDDLETEFQDTKGKWQQLSDIHKYEMDQVEANLKRLEAVGSLPKKIEKNLDKLQEIGEIDGDAALVDLEYTQHVQKIYEDSHRNLDYLTQMVHTLDELGVNTPGREMLRDKILLAIDANFKNVSDVTNPKKVSDLASVEEVAHAEIAKDFLHKHGYDENLEPTTTDRTVPKDDGLLKKAHENLDAVEKMAPENTKKLSDSEMAQKYKEIEELRDSITDPEAREELTRIYEEMKEGISEADVDMLTEAANEFLKCVKG